MELSRIVKQLRMVDSFFGEHDGNIALGNLYDVSYS